MDPRETLEGVLADFARETGRELKLDSRNGCTFFVADMPMNLTLLPSSGQVLLWSWLGKLGDDVNAPRRARRLLELNDAWEGSHGGTFMMDPETGVVMIADRRHVESVCDADRFSAWIESIVAGITEGYTVTEREFPYVDDGLFEDEAPLIAEIPDGKEVR